MKALTSTGKPRVCLGRNPWAGPRGFTLVEMLVAMAVLSIMTGAIFAITSETSQAWTSASQRIGQFESARTAFASMTASISHATLNTYYDYYDASGNRRTTANAASFTPAQYGRATELEFVSGTGNATGLTSSSTTAGTSAPSQITHSIFFAAPLGYTANYTECGVLDNLLCVCGYYIQYSVDPAVPSFLSSGSPSGSNYRFRLMQVLVPTEKFPLYASANNNTWINGMWPQAGSSGWVHQIATNIIALIILPEDPTPGSPAIAPKYDYDSRSGTITTATYAQLPPIVHVAMVALDEKSALRMGNPSTPPLNYLNGASFTQASMFEQDLAQLQTNLNNLKYNSCVFETRIALRECKWSSQ